MNVVSVCVDGGEPGTHNLPCLYRSCCSQNVSTSTSPEALQEMDGQMDRETETKCWREGAAVCGGGMWEQKAPRVLLLLLLKERVKREKESEDERARERERERDCWLSWLCSRG